MTTLSLANAVALIASGRTGEALNALRALAEENPGHLGTRYALAHALERLEQWPEAWRAWQDAANLAGPAPPIVDVEQIINEMQAGMQGGGIALEEFDLPEPELSDDDVVTETWARILAGQKQYSEAARVYAKLAQKHPESAEHYTAQADHMRAQASRSA